MDMQPLDRLAFGLLHYKIVGFQSQGRVSVPGNGAHALLNSLTAQKATLQQSC